MIRGSSPVKSIYPKTLENDYARALKRRLRLAAKAVKLLLVDGENDDVIKFDSQASDETRIESVVGRVRLRYFETYNEAADEELANDVAAKATGYVDRQVGRQRNAVLGVNLQGSSQGTAPRMALIRAPRKNVESITTIGESFFDDLAGNIRKAMSEGKRWEQLAGTIQSTYGVSSRRAALIARDQMGALISQINREKQQASGATRYIWRTSGDARVVGAPGGLYKPNERHGDHYARDGEVFSWANPPHDGHPGEAINCRCTAEPVWDDVEEDTPNEQPSTYSIAPLKIERREIKWERQKTRLIAEQPTDNELDRKLEKSKKHWDEHFDGLDALDRDIAFEALHAKLHANEFDLNKNVKVKISTKALQKYKGTENIQADVEQIYKEIGNLFGQAPLGAKFKKEVIVEPLLINTNLKWGDEFQFDSLSVYFTGHRANQKETVRNWTNARLKKEGAHGGRTNGFAINIGGNFKNAETFKATQFHEFGHYVERMNPRVFEASSRFLEKRTKGSSLKTLNEITGRTDYGRNEKALEGGFYNEYVGKVYRGRDGNLYATEVLSMGIQEFVTPDRMNAFQRKDPEHFALIMNILSGEYGYAPPPKTVKRRGDK